jgi:DNA (cytosine-5)-methyltransferase 1
MKILNLYAGIGGNRKLWGDEHQITAVENEQYIADAYQALYPNDTVVVGDAHQYLLEHYSEFDFIWSSPPCPSHGQYRYNVGVRAKGYKPLMPDMKLYAEIIFLQHYYNGKWAVENVKPYYTPLLSPTKVLQRHFLWSNFDIPTTEFIPSNIRSKNKLTDFEDDISNTNISNKRQALRNAVDPKLGLHIFNAAQTKQETML